LSAASASLATRIALVLPAAHTYTQVYITHQHAQSALGLILCCLRSRQERPTRSSLRPTNSAVQGHDQSAEEPQHPRRTAQTRCCCADLLRACRSQTPCPPCRRTPCAPLLTARQRACRSWCSHSRGRQGLQRERDRHTECRKTARTVREKGCGQAMQENVRVALHSRLRRKELDESAGSAVCLHACMPPCRTHAASTPAAYTHSTHPCVS
jgi:hypothetical protein